MNERTLGASADQPPAPDIARSHPQTPQISAKADTKTEADILMKEWAECGRMMTWCGGQMIANMTFGATIIAALAVGGSRLREFQAETPVKSLLLIVIGLATIVALAFMYFGWIQLRNLAHYWEMCLARAAVVERQLGDLGVTVRLAREAIRLRGNRVSQYLVDLAEASDGNRVVDEEAKLEVKELAPRGFFGILFKPSGRTKLGVAVIYTLFGVASVAVIAALSVVAVINSRPPRVSASAAGTPNLTELSR